MLSWKQSASMILLLLMFNSALFAKLDFALANKCQQIDTSLLPACAHIGYKYTANFSSVGQKSYQAFVSSEVTLFANRFNSCSPHSRAFACARYVPKCSESVQGPVLPCREVCEQFVDDCDTLLRESGLFNRYVAYCRLLSPEKDNSKQCYKPPGFIHRANNTKERTLPSCEKVTKPACLSDNLNGLGNKTRTRLQSLLNNLGPVLNSNCSFNLKRLACFIETSPCVTNNGHTLYTCQSLCQEVWSSCDGEFQRHNIFFPKCIPNFSEVSSGDGLCQQLQWPVPWPNSGYNSTAQRLQCYCNECENNKCTTDGSCLALRSRDATTVFVQSCLDRGPKRDLVCNSTLPTKQKVHCCEKDFCNGKHVTAKPTEISNKEKGRVKKKNAPDNSTPGKSDDKKKKKEKKNGISGGILTIAVVGFLIVIFVVTLLLHTVVKKLKNNSRARRRASAKYVTKSNISSNGTAVTIGDSNKGFEDRDMHQNESALYY